jgi:hypothetical protein
MSKKTVTKNCLRPGPFAVTKHLDHHLLTLKFLYISVSVLTLMTMVIIDTALYGMRFHGNDQLQDSWQFSASYSFLAGQAILPLFLAP